MKIFKWILGIFFVIIMLVLLVCLNQDIVNMRNCINEKITECNIKNTTYSEKSDCIEYVREYCRY